MSFWQKGYFELKSTEIQIQEEHLNFTFLSKNRISTSHCESVALSSKGKGTTHDQRYRWPEIHLHGQILAKIILYLSVVLPI
jgi:hypothetical protein